MKSLFSSHPPTRMRAFLFLLVFVLSFPAFAQQDFKGILYGKDELPLPEATVFFAAHPEAAMLTDENGQFTLFFPEGKKEATLVINFRGLVVEKVATKAKQSGKFTHLVKLPEAVQTKLYPPPATENANENANEFFPADLTRLDVFYDLFYDPRRKTVEVFPKSVGLIAPGELRLTGLEFPIAYYDFKELQRSFAKLSPEEQRWVSAQNPMQRSTLIHALQARWFRADLGYLFDPLANRMNGLHKPYYDEDTLEEEEKKENQKYLAHFRSILGKENRALDAFTLKHSYSTSDFQEKLPKLKRKKRYAFVSTIGYSFDSRDTLNWGFMRKEQELSKILIELTKKGELQPYADYALKKPLSQDQFLQNLALEEEGGGLSAEELEMGFGESSEDWGSGDGWGSSAPSSTPAPPMRSEAGITNTEDYAKITENGFLSPLDKALSTFSLDVDGAAYSNSRRFLSAGQLPPKDAVRIEEFINYFTYEADTIPEGQDFSVNTELSDCPWNDGHKLLYVGLRGRDIPAEKLPPTNLVLLLDVSGSMNSEDKLPLLKQGLRMLIKQLKPTDRVAIVVYAGAAGLVLPSTPATEQDSILNAFGKLSAGGSTAGGEGILLAYKIAEENFIKDGNNRIILATDGDFNVGASSNAAMEKLIEEKRKTGVFLTVLGFGTGNLQDSKMELLANKGNGNYAYIDNALEAYKVLVREFSGTLFTIAKDVKFQLEFNPKQVAAYRLIGYENRLLAAEDFNDDRKDAGELGAGHSVTALYELIPAARGFAPRTDPLKYQKRQVSAANSTEWLTLKLRYKQPQDSVSQLLSYTVTQQVQEVSRNFRLAAALAQFGMILRESPYKGTATYATTHALAQAAAQHDPHGYRKELLNLIKTTEALWEKSWQDDSDWGW